MTIFQLKSALFAFLIGMSAALARVQKVGYPLVFALVVAAAALIVLAFGIWFN